jgi:FkbM family methyltransferase
MRLIRRCAVAVLASTSLAASLLHAEARVWDLTPYEKRYSQFNEELVIRHFFADRRDGVFVDVGCYHWKQYSTSYYLEEQLGWSGLGIDALPWLRAGYEKNRKATRFFNYLVSDSSGAKQTLFAAGPLSSTDAERIEAWLPGRERKPIEVETITLNDLLDRAGVETVDFLSMDIEGGEAAALRGFDIARFRPDLVCIEVAQANRDFVESYFSKHGYQRLEEYAAYDSVNQYYARRGRGPEPGS